MHRNINKKFWIIGTNPSKYINNFICHLSYFENAFFSISNNNLVDENQEIVFRCNSKTTLEQNLIAWQSFGFIKRNGGKIWIIVPKYDKDYYFEYAKINLLINSNDERANRFKDSIIIILLAINGYDVVYNFELEHLVNKTFNDLSNEKIKKQFGAFEKFCINDNGFLQLITNWWGAK